MSDPNSVDSWLGVERRLAAKRRNESIKLTAMLLNNLAVGIFVGGLVGPSASGRHFDLPWYAALTAAAGGLHLTGRWQLTRLRSEE